MHLPCNELHYDDTFDRCQGDSRRQNSHDLDLLLFHTTLTLLARSGLLPRSLRTLFLTLNLPLLRHLFLGSLALTHRSSNGTASLDLLDIVLQLRLKLLDDLAAGVNSAAVWDWGFLNDVSLAESVELQEDSGDEDKHVRRSWTRWVRREHARLRR